MAAAPPITDRFLGALVREARARNTSPEIFLRAWWAESRLNPHTSGDGNHFGINALWGKILRDTYGIDPQEYVTRSAEAQLPVVFRDVDDRMRAVGVKSWPTDWLYEAANICPGRVHPNAQLGDTFASAGDTCYDGNSGLDRDKKKYITYGDIAAWLEASARESNVLPSIVARLPALQSSGQAPVAFATLGLLFAGLLVSRRGR